jgi:GrpB-like predicted nucleotidyltransferase (UPF0157 family)
MHGPVVIVDYDSRWPALYEEWAGKLVGAFEPYALSLEHIGSTSVPGLAAKPVIDICVMLNLYPLPAEAVAAVEVLGLTHKGEYGIEGRHYFSSALELQPQVHIHAYSPGNEEWTAHLLFRDYLRAHPEAAREYEALKRDLAARYTTPREIYTDGKTDFVTETLTKARSKVTSET